MASVPDVTLQFMANDAHVGQHALHAATGRILIVIHQVGIEQAVVDARTRLGRDGQDAIL
jgi:hypothetical protein